MALRLQRDGIRVVDVAIPSTTGPMTTVAGQQRQRRIPLESTAKTASSTIDE